MKLKSTFKKRYCCLETPENDNNGCSSVNIEVINTSTSSVSPTDIRSVVRNELHQLLVRFNQIFLHPDKHHKGLVNIANRHRFPMLAMLVLLSVFDFVIRGTHRRQ